MTDDKLKPTQADKDCASRVLGYANWDAIFNQSPRDGSGISPIPSPGLRWSAERGAKEIARYRIAATDTQPTPSQPASRVYDRDLMVHHDAPATDTQVKHSELADRLEAMRNCISPNHRISLPTGDPAAFYIQMLILNHSTILAALRQAPDAQVSSLVSALRDARGIVNAAAIPLAIRRTRACEVLAKIDATLDGVGNKS